MSEYTKCLETVPSGGTWVAQLVKCPTLDLGSGLDIEVVSSSPMSHSMLGHGAYFKKKNSARCILIFPAVVILAWITAGVVVLNP